MEFDLNGIPSFCEEPHKNSLDKPIPGSEFIDSWDTARVARMGNWMEGQWRGTAAHRLATTQPGASLRVKFEGEALSLVLPPNFVPPGPKYGHCANGSFVIQVDGGPEAYVQLEGAGREVLAASRLSGDEHEAVVKCVGGAGNGSEASVWSVAGFRAWHKTPSAVRFRVYGHPLLVDLRADVDGPVSFTRSVREARWGWASLVVPEPGRYKVRLKALGWKEEVTEFDAPAPGVTETITPVRTALEPFSEPAEPRALSAEEPLVLICIGHANTWGQEAAEYIERLVPQWNEHEPHAVILANEVNPAYLMGALKGLECPWVTGTGNHSMAGFVPFLGNRHQEVRVGPVQILSFGIEAAQDSFESVFCRFSPDATFRVLGGYQANAPWRRVNIERVRLYYYGHELVRSVTFEENGTTYLRKLDANSYFCVELGPPHTFEAPVRIERFIVRRED